MATLLLTGLLLGVQAAQGVVVGTVRDGEGGQPLEGATVVLADLDRTALTDREGRYRLEDVPAGPQHLTVRRLGYAERSLHALVPREGTLEVNVELRPEPIVLEGVEVRGTVPMRGFETPERETPSDLFLTLAAVRHHPLLAEPDAFQALAGGDVVVLPEAPGGVHVRGGASDHTAYVLDGIPVFSPYHAAGVFSAWSPDALASLELASSAPSPVHPDALSGTISGVTRSPGARLSAQGGLGTSQARATIDGPLGLVGAGFLLSLRSGFPGILAPDGEPSYLRGSTRDGLLKVEAPARGGRLQLLAYESRNGLDAAALAEDEEPPVPTVPPDARNTFEWASRSLGAEWRGGGGPLAWRVRGWSATGEAESRWLTPQGLIDLDWERRDEGLLAALERVGDAVRSSLGVRLERSRTGYLTSPAGDGAGAPAFDGWSLGSSDLIGTVFVEHARPLAPTLRAELAASLALAGGELHVGPRARLRWTPGGSLSLAGSFARLHQYAQSLRNPESVVGTVFPVDLHAGAGSVGVPVARSDQWALAAELRPAAGFRLSARGWLKDMDGLVLVAAAEGRPFAAGPFAVGRGEARGLALDLVGSGTRYGLLATWGWQRVRFRSEEERWAPVHGSSHLLDAGVVLFPTATSELKLGGTALLGRRTTPLAGSLEWESCNLVDEGCEFGGSPDHGGEEPGGAALPAYLRLDVGARKHWHVQVAGRDALLALYGTVTNVAGRRNVLTWARDASGARTPVEMRPVAPLVVGLEWRL